ncbi:MAG: response regulator [Coraliomargarita sp.]
MEPILYGIILVLLLGSLGLYLVNSKQKARIKLLEADRAAKNKQDINDAYPEQPVEAATEATVGGHEGLTEPASNALFATLSHELRTPLNGVLGISQMLNEEHDSEDYKVLEGCARHMLAVLHTLVNLSKVQAEWGQLPEYREWVSLHDLTEQIKKNLHFRARTRGLKIEIEHQDKTLRLRGDSDHLKTIIETALLGSIERVDIGDLPDEEKTLFLNWHTTDTDVKVVIDNPLERVAPNRGERISEVAKLTTGQSHSRIQMEFLYWAVSSALLEHYKGAMLAVAIEPSGVRTTLAFEMERMHASMSESLPVGGLRLDSAGKAPKAMVELPQKFKILVAEDDPINRGLMSMLLEHMGQDAHLVTNGQEVLDKLEVENDFDLILMDIDMPVLDGMATSRALRIGEAGDRGMEIPIVAVTAFNALSDQGKFKKAGMDYFLPKPLGLAHLREVLLEIIRKQRQESE